LRCGYGFAISVTVAVKRATHLPKRFHPAAAFGTHFEMPFHIGGIVMRKLVVEPSH
jgi:hypothetical protein